jgi:hypothetical protein
MPVIHPRIYTFEGVLRAGGAYEADRLISSGLDTSAMRSVIQSRYPDTSAEVINSVIQFAEQAQQAADISQAGPLNKPLDRSVIPQDPTLRGRLQVSSYVEYLDPNILDNEGRPTKRRKYIVVTTGITYTLGEILDTIREQAITVLGQYELTGKNPEEIAQLAETPIFHRVVRR